MKAATLALAVVLAFVACTVDDPCDTFRGMSNTQIQPGGGARPPALATVCTDQKTIRGSGSSDDPLHASGGLLTYPMAGGANPSEFVGYPMRFQVSLGVKYINTAIANNVNTSTVLGVMVKGEDAAGGEGTVQTTGIVTLPPGFGDLTPGAVYYVDDAFAGYTSVRPTTSGHTITQVGYALSENEIQLQLSMPQVIP